jgi:hypothetical protein
VPPARFGVLGCSRAKHATLPACARQGAFCGADPVVNRLTHGYLGRANVASALAGAVAALYNL